MSPLVAAHALAAAVVVVLGGVNLLRRRRDRVHRVVGRTWALAMVLTCLSSFGIRPHGLSWLHGLATFTLVMLAVGVVYIRRGDVTGHRATMIGTYIGTLIAFGFAALAPNRLISRLAVSDPWTLLAAIGLVLAICAAILTLAARIHWPHRRPDARAALTPADRARLRRCRSTGGPVLHRASVRSCLRQGLSGPAHSRRAAP